MLLARANKAEFLPAEVHEEAVRRGVAFQESVRGVGDLECRSGGKRSTKYLLKMCDGFVSGRSGSLNNWLSTTSKRLPT